MSHIMFDSLHIGNIRDWYEIFWSMMDEDYKLGVIPILIDGF